MWPWPWGASTHRWLRTSWPSIRSEGFRVQQNHTQSQVLFHCHVTFSLAVFSENKDEWFIMVPRATWVCQPTICGCTATVEAPGTLEGWKLQLSYAKLLALKHHWVHVPGTTRVTVRTHPRGYTCLLSTLMCQVRHIHNCFGSIVGQWLSIST